MNARISIPLVRATNRCIRGSRIPVECGVICRIDFVGKEMQDLDNFIFYTRSTIQTP